MKVQNQMPKALPISATILVKDAQSTILECLESLKNFDEIILLDNQSSDDTLKIAKEFNETYKNLKIYTSEFIGFGALKNLALSYARNEWIFSIDSDEVLESSALDEIARLYESGKLKDSKNIFSLPRRNLYNGEWIKACGWYPDFVIRLFNKTYTRFNKNLVHESIIIPKDAILQRLDSPIKHYAYDNIAHLIEKMQIYSSLYTNQNPNKSSSPLKACIHSGWTFFRNYVLKKGFLYGYKGFIISVCNGLGAFFKYMKLYENTKAYKKESPPPSRSCSLIITTYNQKDRLALVLDSVRDLAVLPSEVLIADDGSAQDTKELIKSYASTFPVPLIHIWQEDKGFRASASRNNAIREAKGEYIILIDGDMILEPHFVLDHLESARKGVFLQGSRTILDSNDSKDLLDSNNNAYKKAFNLGGFKARRLQFLKNLIYKTSRLDSRIFKKKTLIKGIRSCNISFFKSDCEAINGFNEEFVGWGREDSEFVARFLFNGGEFRRLKFAGIAYHIWHPENARDMLESNHQIYLDTLKNKSTRCQKGLNKD